MPFQHGRLVEWISDWLRGTDFTPAERAQVSHFGPVTPVVDITAAARGHYAQQWVIDVDGNTPPSTFLLMFTVPSGEILNTEAFSGNSTSGIARVILIRRDQDGIATSFDLFNILAGSSYQPLVRDRLQLVAGDQVGVVLTGNIIPGLVAVGVLGNVEYTAGGPSGVNSRYGPLPLTSG